MPDQDEDILLDVLDIEPRKDDADTRAESRSARQAAVNFVFNRPVGQVGQELGGVAVCVLALASAAGLSADAEEQREVERVLAKPRAEFRDRNAAKNAAGFRAK